jgi:hypothetical protein
LLAGLLDEFKGKIGLTVTSLLWGGIAAAAAQPTPHVPRMTNQSHSNLGGLHHHYCRI